MKAKIAFLVCITLLLTGCISPVPRYNSERLNYLEARMDTLEKTIEAQSELNTVLIMKIAEQDKLDQVIIEHLNKVEELVKTAKNQHFL